MGLECENTTPLGSFKAGAYVLGRIPCNKVRKCDKKAVMDLASESMDECKVVQSGRILLSVKFEGQK